MCVYRVILVDFETRWKTFKLCAVYNFVVGWVGLFFCQTITLFSLCGVPLRIRNVTTPLYPAGILRGLLSGRHVLSNWTLRFFLSVPSDQNLKLKTGARVFFSHMISSRDVKRISSGLHSVGHHAVMSTCAMSSWCRVIL